MTTKGARSRDQLLRERIAKIEEVALICIERSADPKDRAEHERWRSVKLAELRRALGL